MEKFLVEISARHVHLCQKTVDALFGEGHQLTPIKDLSQPGQYACEEKVTVSGPRGKLSFRILGPTRKEDQIEVSLTEARQLGVEALIRESGHLEGTCGCTVEGPCGSVELEKGVIAAKRHIHMEPKDGEYYGVKNGDIVAVRVETPERSIIFDDTVVRINENYRLAMHIDTDESNAAGLKGNGEGEIFKL